MTTALPIATVCGPYTTYRCGDLAAFADVSPGDVLEWTKDMTHRWEHPDELKPFWNYAEVLAWLRRACHGSHAADIEIVFWKAGWEQIAKALGVEERS